MTQGASPCVGHIGRCILDERSDAAWLVEEAMCFRKPASVVCAVCGKTITSDESRFVERAA
jgi:hypothetical protein